MLPYLIAAGFALGIALVGVGGWLERRGQQAENMYPRVTAAGTVEEWQPPTLG